MSSVILEVKNLKKSFRSPRVLAVDGVSFAVERGKTLGIVGESGSGKSTLALLALGLAKPDAGEVLFEGKRIDKMKKDELKSFRRQAQIVFQEPLESLDPRMTVESVLAEPFLIHGHKPADEQTDALLAQVTLGVEFKKRLPRNLSGGECQRVSIARALALGPKLIVCDEPVTALDVIAQAQVLNLLLKLQKEKGVSYLFISHDLKVVKHMSDQILVMKDGQISGNL